tara:strand:+ start:16627 stop:17637 length:1011 start_codon:yes stop_codon:yes gene_type:complete
MPALAPGGAAAAEPAMVGYLPAFKGLEKALRTTPIDYYTHINIAFANPDSSGAMTKGDELTCMAAGMGENASVAMLREAVTELKRKGAKVLLSVAGGVIPSCAGDWAELLATDRGEAVRAELLDLMDAAGFDGIDIDIEGALLTRIDRDGNYTPFIAHLSQALQAKGKLLTVATASYEGGMIPVSSIPYFDLVMPMSYDAIGPSWGAAGAEHASYAQAQDDLRLWLERGVAPERLALGLPFYGYGFGNYGPDYAFADLIAAFPQEALTEDLVGEACSGCDYITFNSVATIRQKVHLAMEQAGGVMVWEMTQDTHDQLLGRTIDESLRPLKNTPKPD